MKFTWDKQKNRKNKEKHKIDFALAIQGFNDPHGLITLDVEHATLTEHREWLIAEIEGRILVVIFTIRYPGPVLRIISARPANKKERNTYEKIKNFSLR